MESRHQFQDQGTLVENLKERNQVHAGARGANEKDAGEVLAQEAKYQPRNHPNHHTADQIEGGRNAFERLEKAQRRQHQNT